MTETNRDMHYKKFSALKPEFLDRWKIAVGLEGILPEAYLPEIRIITDPSGRCEYTFGVIRNEHRYKKIENRLENEGGCNICKALELSSRYPQMNLLPDEAIRDLVVIPNKFPIIQGFSMAVSKTERPMYTTRDLGGFVEELGALTKIGGNYGLEVFHNSYGFGATIPGHEHWHLTTFREGYDLTGKAYGFDAAEKERVKGNSGVSIMPQFPFEHLIFDRDIEKIARFLKRIQNELGGRYDNGVVPHTISEGLDGFLVAIGKKFKLISKSSAEVAGHMVVKTKEEILKMDFDSCMKEIDELLLRRGNLNLERFI